MKPSISRLPLAWLPSVAVSVVCLSGAPVECLGQTQSPVGGTDRAVRTLDAISGALLPGALVSFPGLDERSFTDSLGVARVPAGAGEPVRIAVRLLGYADLDTVIVVPRQGGTVDLPLQRSAIVLPSLTIEAERAGTDSRELVRQMFDREVSVGALGVTQAEVSAVPAIGEADVFRSLESFAGVTSTTDFSSEMYLRGGDYDQVAVLFEGAPVFGPYHMFGMFGLFNADAVESVELYKGAIPARYGGALSGVLAARQRVGGSSGPRFSGGLSMLGLRLAAVGSAPWADAQWMAAGRRATISLSTLPTPYSFHDLNLGVRLHPGEEHRVSLSLLATQDDFGWGLGLFGDSFDSNWSNLVSSATWSWVRGNGLTSDVTAYASRYDAMLGVGADGTGPVTTNRVGAVGLRSQLTIRGNSRGARVGFVTEGGSVRLRGTAPGAYIAGDAESPYLHGFVFAELEQWIGPLRLAPGLRAGTRRGASRAFLEPRLSARLYLGPFAASASLDRGYQFLSTVRDDRFVFPGAPMWSVRDGEQPIAVADGASVALDYWRDERWTASAGFWTRRFRDTPHWRPESVRDLSALEYHDGQAHGWELSLQRHAGPVRGWLSYHWGKVALKDEPGGRRYSPNWDRRHEFDATVSVRELFGFSASVRTRVATGNPFWFPAGSYPGLTYNPTAIHPAVNSPDNPPRGLDYSYHDTHIVLSDVQGRLPYYGRVDVSLRYAFRWSAWRIEPFATLANITGRENVYSFYPMLARPERPEGVLSSGNFSPKLQLPPFPFFGIDFSF
ncbi:MAG: TonB-dependent receptor [Gemmatimonadetes bacterium]|nr:TonB-dependent receptor [Gemmatimonadota bacterium]